MKPKFAFFLILILFRYAQLFAQTDSTHYSLNGQLVGWTTLQFENPFTIQPGGRFVPQFLAKYGNENAYFDVEVSFNINGSITFQNGSQPVYNSVVKPYRFWARYATDAFEIRAGLQKINFGQAKIFRPLMWFDGMDVRDPLQLTDGVYGVLAKYFFKNNANLWCWALIGNENRKGWEYFGTEKWKPEIGGRIEIPVLKGEMALSTNFRNVHAINMLSSALNDYRTLNETKIGVDGKWDVGVGLWFENSTTITQKNNIVVPRYQDMWNVGLDYTLPIGNGIGMTAEYLRFHSGENFLTRGSTFNLVGAMLNYPVSIMDNLSLMLFYMPDQMVFMNYFSWSKVYDKWSIYFMGFLNPKIDYLPLYSTDTKNVFAGKGFQIMVSYNF